MANNYILLQSIQLTQTTASVTFSNIPQSGYTDLKVLTSTRMTASGYGTDMTIAFNGSTSNFEGRRIYGYSGSAYSDTQSNVSGLVVGTSATANTFSVNELYIPNYLSSNVKSYSIDAVSENNSATAYLLEISANRWLSTAAINSITFGVSSSSFAAGSSFSLYGIAATGTDPIGASKASGGNTVISDGTYWYHAFTSSGTFTPVTSLTTQVLVIAGGGGGGNSTGGGGGAGGVCYHSSFSAASNTAYAVTVGAGGVRDATGNNSTFSNITALGGGLGGGEGITTGMNGGSGGGAGRGTGANISGGTATQGNSNGATGYGNNGGSGYGNNNSGYLLAGGGGGGAGAAGGNASSQTPGTGGNGLSTWSTWGAATGTGQNVSGTYWYAGGGGGGMHGYNTTALGGQAGGNGGGGAGSDSNGNNTNELAVAGTANTGGGGGGAGNAGTSAAGGSGIVIIRYPV